MQRLVQPLVISGWRGTHRTADTNRLVAGLTMEYVVQAVDAAGAPAPPAGMEDVDSWRFVMAADWDPDTAPCYATEEVDYDETTASWSVALEGTRTQEMVDALEANGSIRIGCEIVGLPAGGDWAHPVYVLQWTATILNRRDSGHPPTPDPAGDATVRNLDVTALVQTPRLRLYDRTLGGWVEVVSDGGRLVVSQEVSE